MSESGTGALSPNEGDDPSGARLLARRIRRMQLRIAAIGITMMVLVSLTIAFILAQEHDRGLAAARERTQGAARSYAASLATLLTHVEVLLQGMRLTVTDSKLGDEGITTQQVSNLLARFKAADSMLMDFLLIDTEGRVVLWTGPGDPPLIADRAYFTVHRDQPHHGLYVGPGRLSRAYLGEWFFPASLRLSGREGQFLGVLMAAIDLRLVRQRLETLKQDNSEIVTVTDIEGRILARLPGGLDVTGRHMANPIYPDARKTEMTLELERDPIEPQSVGGRMVTYRKIDRFPLVVSASLPLSVVLDNWYRGMTYGIGFIVLSCVLILLAMVLIARQQVSRLRAGAALEKSRRDLEGEHLLIQTLIDTMPVLMFVRDAEGRYLRCNRRFSEQMHNEPVVGRTIADFQPGEDGEIAARSDQEVLRTAMPQTYEYTACLADGSRHHLMITKAPLRAPSGDVVAVIGTAVDISERRAIELSMQAEKDRAEQALKTLREAQASLIQSEKMASLGGLVAGIAHEVNTPVGVTLTGASHLDREVVALQRRLDDRSLTMTDLQSFLTAAKEATGLLVASSQRAADLIHSFKQVAVDQTSGHRRTFGLKDYIDEVLVSLRPKFKNTAHQVVVTCPDDVEMDSYPGALSQVLTNLLLNSLVHGFDGVDAGTITLTIRLAGDDQVHLVYTDSGKGIRPEVLPHVFDPFFTTRRAAGGSGLGLNIVYNIVSRTLRGTVTLDSTPGEGVRFTLVFPRRTVDLGKGAPA